jgi:hypothetical protein
VTQITLNINDLTDAFHTWNDDVAEYKWELPKPWDAMSDDEKLEDAYRSAETLLHYLLFGTPPNGNK